MNKKDYINKVKKTDLSKFSNKKKVDLSIVDDIQNKLDSFEEAEGLASYLAYEYGDEIMEAFSNLQQKYNIDDYVVNSSVTSLDEFAENLAKDLDKVQAAADELGLDPSDLYDNYHELRQRVDHATLTLYSDAFDKYIEVINYIGNNNFWR